MNRAPISADTLRAAYGAHLGEAHGGRIGYRCTTCSRYLAAAINAEADERAREDDLAQRLDAQVRAGQGRDQPAKDATT